ncbi:MAG: hypothetical protein CMJ75_03365 [Planctomycetaceae bacterium]|nr:hypothetical protein [Planctomycetaceae bacterium]
MTAKSVPRVQEIEIPPNLRATLCEYTDDIQDSVALQRQVNENGYALLRGVLDREQIIAARKEVFSRLGEVGEISGPVESGIGTGISCRREIAGDLNAFWRDVSTGEALRAVTHGPQLCELLGRFFGEDARPHDLVYLRPMSVGRATRLHYDFPFFAGYSKRIYTAWIPLGEIDQSEGPLLIIENSHEFLDWIEPIRNHDYQSEHANEVVQRAAYEQPNSVDPVTLAEQRGVRLLSADFQPGDLVVFSGFVLHGSLDNCSTIGRVRLSCDVRFQPAADSTADQRYFGTDPVGSAGGGYGAMKGALPLDE